MQRNDELVIETKNLATDQDGWSFNVPLVGYNQYSVCKVCVYLALEGGRFLETDEMTGARRVLKAAGFTYVAAAIMAVGQLLYFLLRSGLLGGGRRDD